MNFILLLNQIVIYQSICDIYKLSIRHWEEPMVVYFMFVFCLDKRFSSLQKTILFYIKKDNQGMQTLLLYKN